jgi:hypothetical protein
MHIENWLAEHIASELWLAQLACCACIAAVCILAVYTNSAATLLFELNQFLHIPEKLLSSL